MVEITVDIEGGKYIMTFDDDYLEHISNGFESLVLKCVSTKFNPIFF